MSLTNQYLILASLFEISDYVEKAILSNFHALAAKPNLVTSPEALVYLGLINYVEYLRFHIFF